MTRDNVPSIPRDVWNRRRFLQTAGLGAAALITSGCASLLGARRLLPSGRRPNILFIMADDHASHAMSCYGSRINKTPNMDRIAREGALFRNCFCTNSICAPSRAVILTGRYSHINGVMDNVPPFLNAWAAVTLTNRSGVLVFGETEPGSAVSVAGDDVLIGAFGNFSTTVGLAPGNNRITVASHDRAGNYNFAVVEVLWDNVPPGLDILKPAEGQVINAPSLEVCGTSYDANGIAGIEVGVDDANYTFAAGNVSWRGMVMVPEGNHTVDVLAYDRAGNSNKVSLNVSYNAPAQDRTPPVITVRFPVAAEVSTRTIEVRGQVFDQGGVSSVQISSDNRTFRSCTLAASRDEWSSTVTLRQGTNTFYIRAWDTQGNNATQVMKVDYAPPPSSSSPPNWGLPLLVAVIVVAAAASIYMSLVVLRRWTDNIEPGLGEDEAVISFPGKGLK